MCANEYCLVSCFFVGFHYSSTRYFNLKYFFIAHDLYENAVYQHKCNSEGYSHLDEAV